MNNNDNLAQLTERERERERERDILNENISTLANNTVLGVEGTITCINGDTACTKDLICIQGDTVLCDPLDTCNDAILCPDDIACDDDFCTSNYVYYDCSNDNTIATRSWFNSYITPVTKFTSDLDMVLIRSHPSDYGITSGAYNIKGNYNNNQAVLRRDVGQRVF